MAEDFDHGTNVGYRWRKCRCNECKAYNTRRMAQYRGPAEPRPERPVPAPKPKKKPPLGFGEAFTAFVAPAKTFEQYVRDAEDATNPAFIEWLRRRRG